MNYSPERWVILKVTSEEGIHYRLFGCWYGGYTGDDYWKLNSGITRAVLIGNKIVFEGVSGSQYSCDVMDYGCSSFGYSVIESFKSIEGVEIEILPESTVDTILSFDWKCNS